MADTISDLQAGTNAQPWNADATDVLPRRLVCLCNIALGVLIVALTNHFLLDEMMERFYARLSSPAIGLHLYEGGGSNAIRDRISLFLLDDDDLAAYGVAYPVPYAFHARRLRAIAARRPAAIFIDLWFHDQRRDDDIGVLVEALCDIADDGVNVYLASISHVGEHRQLHPALRRVAAPSDGAVGDMSAQDCFTEVSPVKQTDGLDGIDWEYPLWVSGPGGTTASAAVAIYNGLRPNSPLPDDDLALVWGVTPHVLNAQLMRNPQTNTRRCRDDNLHRDMFPVSYEALSRLVPDRWLSEDVPLCPYHLALPVRALRDWIDPRNPFHATLEPAIVGRVIMYGLNLQGISDGIRSPVHGPLPGAHLHAMALDNLLRYGPRYPVAQGFDFSVNRGTLIPLGLIVALSVSLAWWNVCIDAYKRSGSHGWGRAVRFLRLIETPERSFISAPRKRLEDLEGYSQRLAQYFEQRYRAQRAGMAGHAGRSLLIVLVLLLFALRFTLCWVLRIGLAVVFLIVLALVSLSLFGLGPLTWIEFAIAPLVLELLGTGEKFAGTLVRLRDAATGNNWLT